MPRFYLTLVSSMIGSDEVLFVGACSKLVEEKLHTQPHKLIKASSLPKIVRTKLSALMFITGDGNVKVPGVGVYESTFHKVARRRVTKYTIYLNKTEINNECTIM